MPIKKKFKKYVRKSVRKAGFKRRTASIVNQSVRGLQLIGPEMKTCDTNFAAMAAGNVGSVQLLNGVAGGSAINQRVGSIYTIRSISLRGQIYSGLATSLENTVRIMIVYDKSANATALTVANVLDSASPLSHKSLENRSRFWILMDKTYHLNAHGAVNSRREIEWYKKISLKVTCNSNVAGTIGDITTGSVYLVVCGTGVESSGYHQSFSGSCRLRFTDY